MFYILLSPFGCATNITFVEVTDDFDFNDVLGSFSVDVICKKSYALVVDDEFLFKPNLLPNGAASRLYNGSDFSILGNAVLAKYSYGSEDIEPFSTVIEAVEFFDNLMKGGSYLDN